MSEAAAEKPQPYQLWKQAAGDPDRYIELMIHAGHIITREAEASLGDNERLLAATRRERVEAEARDLKQQFDSHTLSFQGFKAICSCEMFAIEDITRESKETKRAREIAVERHARHVRSMVAKTEWGGSGAGCQPFRSTTAAGRVVTGIICTGRSTAGRKRCQVCKSKRRWSVAQCDYPTGGPCKKCDGKGYRGGVEGLKAYNCHDCAGTARAMCNVHLCSECRTKGPGPDEDYCPDHRSSAGIKLKREPCEWAQSDVTAKCIHKGCEEVVVEGERCLWFTRRHRPMCLKCGAEYLETSE